MYNQMTKVLLALSLNDEKSNYCKADTTSHIQNRIFRWPDQPSSGYTVLLHNYAMVDAAAHNWILKEMVEMTKKKKTN